MITSQDKNVKAREKIEFTNRFELFHEKHPEPMEIFGIQGKYNLYRSTNCDTRFLLVLKSFDTIDSHEAITDMLLLKKSLESRFGASNVYWEESYDSWIRLYVFFDFEELCSRVDTLTDNS